MLALAALAVVSCGTQRKTAADNTVAGNTTAPETVSTVGGNADGRLAFGLSLFNEAVSASGNAAENIVVSPYSAGMALSMLAEGAAGDTKAELVFALKNASYSGDILESGDGCIISSANSVWIRSGFPVLPGYASLLKNAYSAEIAERDFSVPATVKEINKWCSDKTSGKIPEIIDNIGSDMMMFLLNAMYFKAPWQYKFDKNSTFKAVFHSPSAVQNTDFMHIRKSFLCGEISGCKFVVLPYKSGNWNMVVCLPAEGVDMKDFLSYVNADRFKSFMEAATMQTVALSMPKFKVNTTLIMNSLLQSMGVHKAFSGAADFRVMTQAGVAVDEVRQKCFIEVNEEGSEAAAVTSVGVRLTSVRPEPRPFIMNVDRPFVFAIFNAENNDILFAGKIATIEN